MSNDSSSCSSCTSSSSSLSSFSYTAVYLQKRLSPSFSSSSLSSNTFLKNYIRARINYFKEQTQVNNQLNNNARTHLMNIYKNEPSCCSRLIITKKSPLKFSSSSHAGFSLVEHPSYWHKFWSFNDNPIYEYGKS
jgi:hypothetical protein